MDPSLVYRKKFLANQLSFKAKYKTLFDTVAKDISVLASDPTAKFTRDFNSFSKSIDQKIAVIMTGFHDKAQALTEEEIRASWAISNEKNNTIVGDYMKGITELKGAQKAAFFLSNTSALEAFISRDHGTGTLSDAVWKVTDQLRGEMEIHLGMGIANGDSAQVISRRIRQYLENPEALFKRVRNADGKLVASKAMIAYRKDNKVGQGVYTSAYKNAMRVSRSETNMAYLLADHIRWMQLDMVIGVKISLSAQHPDYKFVEICEACEGTYPKEFVWTGWHPSCLCHAVPVMMPQDDFRAYLRGEKPMKAKQIKVYPSSFTTYMKGNFDRYSKYKSVPYFMKDNSKIIENIMKLK